MGIGRGAFPLDFEIWYFVSNVSTEECLSLSFGLVEMNFHHCSSPPWKSPLLAPGQNPSNGHGCQVTDAFRTGTRWFTTPETYNIETLCSVYLDQFLKRSIRIQWPKSFCQCKVAKPIFLYRSARQLSRRFSTSFLKRTFSLFSNWCLVSNFHDEVITCLPYLYWQLNYLTTSHFWHLYWLDLHKFISQRKTLHLQYNHIIGSTAHLVLEMK